MSTNIWAQDITRVSAKPPAEKHLSIQASKGASKYRGWDFLVSRLRLHGVREADLTRIYQDSRMPRFSFVPFSLAPRESSMLYTSFLSPDSYSLGASFIKHHKREFDRMERSLHVPREIVTAILVVESRIGRHTGKETVVYRLSRVASVGAPDNLEQNLRRLRSDNPKVTMEQVKARAHYLEETFLPEIPALIEIGKRNKINILSVKGSTAGAFGLPQFLPSAFLRYGVDGSRDGFVSLFNEVDALWSTANYLAAFGYREDLSLDEKRAIIWKYNKSDAYIDTILSVARGVKDELRQR